MTTQNIAVVGNMTIIRANVIAQRTNSMEVGLVKAMMIERLKDKLKNLAHFYFQKKNGEIREAWGTTNPALAKAMTNGRGESRERYGTTAFYDVTIGQWRSLRWESILKVD